MAITQQDIDACRRILEHYKDRSAVQALMDVEEYIAFRFGGISRNRAARLIVAARQNVTTNEIKHRQGRSTGRR